MTDASWGATASPRRACAPSQAATWRERISSAPVETGHDVRRELAAALGISPVEMPEHLWNAGGARLKTLVPLTRRDRLAALTPQPSLIDRLAPLLGSTGLHAFVVGWGDAWCWSPPSLTPPEWRSRAADATRRGLPVPVAE